MSEHTTLGDLTPDPKNARRHTPRNVGMIEQALGEVGAARSIVIDENGVILAGNATAEAAARRGMEKVIVVDADGETIVAVRRRNLTDAQKQRLALFDNRSAETAEWETEVLRDLHAKDPDVTKGMWSDEELSELLDGEEGAGDGATRFNVIVVCGSSEDQTAAYNQLRDLGYDCRVAEV